MHTKEELEAYIVRSELRLVNTASPWMKSEIRKGIALAKAEIAKLGKQKRLAPAVRLYSLGGDVFTTKRPDCPECGLKLRADETCGFCQ